MQVRAEHQGALAAIALREQGAEHAGEHVAHAGARHAGVAGAIDEPVAIARHEDAAVSLEHDVRVQVVRQRARRLDAIGLHRGRALGEQPRRLCGMRRDDGLGAAPRAGMAQVRVLGDEIQCVGVEHARQLARQRRTEQRLGALALAEPGPDHQRVEILAERVVGMAQHELGRAGIERQRRVEQPDIDAAGTELQGRASGEHRGTAHAGCAAEDAERAGHALVEIQRPALERIPEEFRYRHPGARLTRRQAEVVDRDRAAVIRTVERQQSGLQANEGNGVARPDRAAHHPAGVRMQAARDVDREHRTALAVRIIDQARIVALDLAREADAEKTVDDQSPGLVRRDLRLVDQRDAEKLLL